MEKENAQEDRRGEGKHQGPPEDKEALLLKEDLMGGHGNPSKGRRQEKREVVPGSVDHEDQDRTCSRGEGLLIKSLDRKDE